MIADPAAEIEPVAREACAAAGVEDAQLRSWKKTHLLNDCPLLKKSRIAYFCMSGDGGATAGSD